MDDDWPVEGHGVTRIVRPLFAVLVAAALLVAPAPATASHTSCRDADLVPSAGNVKRVTSATLCLLNAERRKRGRPRLRTHPQLARAARRYSASMVRHRFFDHVSPGGSTLTSRVRGGTRYIGRRVRRWSLGENIAWGSGELATPRGIVRSWMRSAGHRRNILDRRFRHIGIGVVTGAPRRLDGGRAATYTTDFGSRAFR